MRYCLDCGGHFARAMEVRGGFRHAFGFREETEYLCPLCGSADLTEGRACPGCVNGWMAKGDRLCADCRADLRRRLIAFADALSEDEALQVDDWLEGRSLCDRGWPT